MNLKLCGSDIFAAYLVILAG